MNRCFLVWLAWGGFCCLGLFGFVGFFYVFCLVGFGFLSFLSFKVRVAFVCFPKFGAETFECIVFIVDQYSIFKIIT